MTESFPDVSKYRNIVVKLERAKNFLNLKVKREKELVT